MEAKSTSERHHRNRNMTFRDLGLCSKPLHSSALPPLTFTLTPQLQSHSETAVKCVRPTDCYGLGLGQYLHRDPWYMCLGMFKSPRWWGKRFYSSRSLSILPSFQSKFFIVQLIRECSMRPSTIPGTLD